MKTQKTIVPNNQRIAKNTLFLYVRLAIVMLVNLYTTRAVLNALGVEDYGVYNVVCGFVALFGFLNTSITNGIQRFYNYELGRNDTNAVIKVYNTAFVIQVLVAVLLLVSIESIGVWYVNNKLVVDSTRLESANWIFQFSVVSLLLVVLQAPYSAAILAYEKMDYYAVVSVIDALIKLSIAIGIPYVFGDKLIAYGFLIMLVQIINIILYYGYCKKNFSMLKLRRGFDKSMFKSMLVFSGWNIFGSFAYVVKSQGVNVLLNAFFGTIVNAANGVATQIASAIQTFSANLVVAFRPQLIQSYASGDYQRTEKLMFSMSKISYILMCLIAIPVIVEINYILQLWLGKDSVPSNTAIFTILTIVSSMINTLNMPIVQVVHATGNMKKFQLATSLVVCSILPLAWICLKCGFSAISVFWVTMFMSGVNQCVCLIVLRSIFKYNVLQYIYQIVIPCFIISVVPSTIAYIVRNMFDVSLYRLFLTFLMSEVLILSLSILFFNKAEKTMLRTMINKFIKR